MGHVEERERVENPPNLFFLLLCDRSVGSNGNHFQGIQCHFNPILLF